jgi:hypothetical protein
VRSSTPGQHRASGPASRPSDRAARPDDDLAQQSRRAGTERDGATGPMPARSPSGRGTRADGKRRAMAHLAPGSDARPMSAADSAPAAGPARTSTALLDKTAAGAAEARYGDS